jgi:hypothetical protein
MLYYTPFKEYPKMPVPLHLYPLSEKALVVAWEQLIDPAIAAQARRLQQQLAAHPFL